MLTELQLYKYIREELNAAEDELNWYGDELILQILPCYLKDFMSFVGEDDSESPIQIAYFRDFVQIDLVPICDQFGIEPENILKKEKPC